MAKCFFCGGPLLPGTGKLLALNSGEIRYFCSSKCEKNTKLGREGTNTKWTALAQKARQKK